jgi:hypothetical protein
MEWETSGDHHWLMWMRCGACGEWLESLVDNRTAAALDIELDRQQVQIAAQADALSRERMAAEVEAFVAAVPATRCPGWFFSFGTLRRRSGSRATTSKAASSRSTSTTASAEKRERVLGRQLRSFAHVLRPARR